MTCLRVVARLALVGAVFGKLQAAAPAELGPAKMAFDGRVLSVTTGRIERRWAVTAAGLKTLSVEDPTRGIRFALSGNSSGSDWNLAGFVAECAPGRLETVDSRVGDDEGFTSRHLEVDAVFSYPGGLRVRYAVWAYPNARGLRTQLWLRGRASGLGGPGAARVDWVPAGGEGARWRYFGYDNDTQHRNDWDKPILREEVREAGAAVDWASGAAIERAGAGLLLVKESQKCVNQPGAETGGFLSEEGGLADTGLRLKPADLRPDRERWAWATWCVLYDGSDADRELALKSFYAIRYPIVPQRDVYSGANTFGSGGSSGVVSLAMAHEDQVLPEIDSVAELGIDRLQIDAGWSDLGGPKTTKAWRPDPRIYPEGWKRIVTRAKERGIGLGLWAPSTAIPLADLEWNTDRGGFVDWKLDYARLATADAIDTNIDKVRTFLQSTGHRSQVIWDVTENAPRYGYFWAREYGGVWLANRKPAVPANAVYKPGVLLRDIWQLARYVNLNKVQIAIQNLSLVSPTLSDARRYNQPYCVAIGLAGIPLFFGTTRAYPPPERAAIKDLLAAWKRHNTDLFASVVFPIGDVPSGHSWTGFQFRHGDQDGYLLVFREPDSPEAAQVLGLRLVANRRLRVEDLRTGQVSAAETDGAGRISLRIARPPDFLFLHYSIAR